MQADALEKAEQVLEPILEKSKELEVMVMRHDPLYNGMVQADAIVRDFIAKNGLIVYGGTAIDMALRLKGSSIYPDDLLPDYDFYSPENVEHAYQMADVLYDAGFKDARAINASHVGTMRVDIGDNHFVADISYTSAEVFATIPTLNYNGVRIVHPHMQRLDVHSSLSFPYDEAPREVVFARWRKDIKRFNKMADFYPMDPTPAAQLAARPVRSKLLSKYVLTGFAAYAAICEWFRAEFAQEPAVPACFAACKDYVEFDTLNGAIEIVHYDMKKVSRELQPDVARYYERYSNMTPARAEFEKGGDTYTVYDTGNRMVSVNTIRIGGHPIRITNVQYLLRHMLSQYIKFKSQPKLAAVYLSRYNSLMDMIQIAQKKPAVNTPLFPTIIVYGSENITMSSEIAMNRLKHSLANERLFVVPTNYYPERSRARGQGHPAFNPDSSVFYRDSGRQIDEDGMPLIVH